MSFLYNNTMNMFVVEFMFLYWSCYLCTKNWRYLSVLEFIFLYWNKYCFTGVYFIVLVNILAQPMNMFVY